MDLFVHIVIDIDLRTFSARSNKNHIICER